MFFNRACPILLTVLSLALSSHISAAKDYPVGTVFNDIIEYDYQGARLKVPLPPGNWKLVSTFVRRTETSNIELNQSYLIRHDKKLVTGVLRVKVPKDFVDSHWSISKRCSNRNRRRSWYIHDDSYEKHENCNVIYPRPRFARPHKTRKELFTYIERMNLVIPNAWVRFHFIRSDKEDYLSISGELALENYGFPRERKSSNSTSPWNIDNISSHPKKKAFMEKTRVWAESWKGLVDKGFKNKLTRAEVLAHPKIDGSFNRPPKKVTRITKLPKSTGASGGDIESRLTKLKSLHDKGLISKSQYDAKRAEILKGL